MSSVPLQQMIEKMELTNLTQEIDISNIRIRQPDINRPALQLAGYFEHFEATRLQIIGFVEYTYMEGQSQEHMREIYEELFSYGIPAIVFCRELKPDPLFLKMALDHRIPLLSTKKTTSSFLAEIIRWLNVKLAPMIAVHGTLVDVFGEGLMITGESGLGKSDAAMELIKRGHRLVSDGMVELRRVSDDALVGSSPELTKYFVELRGIGVVDVKALFGASVVKDTQKVDLVIHMEEWNNDLEYEQLESKKEFVEYLGKKIECHHIFIRPGRNLAIICETAAVNHREKIMTMGSVKV